MSSKKIIVFGIIIIGTILFIGLFINRVNNDKEKIEKNIGLIKDSYNSLKEEVGKYNDKRNEISMFINNFYYDTIEEKHSSNIENLNKYDTIIKNITDVIEELDNLCNIKYTDEGVDKICSSYKTDYETLVNVFVNDFKIYNNKIQKYNTDNNGSLDLFESKYINAYIDYNNDNVYLKKDENDA